MLPNPMIEAELQPERQTSVELRVEWNVAGLLLAPLRSDAASADLDRARLEVAGEVIDRSVKYRWTITHWSLGWSASVVQ